MPSLKESIDMTIIENSPIQFLNLYRTNKVQKYINFLFYITDIGLALYHANIQYITQIFLKSIGSATDRDVSNITDIMTKLNQLLMVLYNILKICNINICKITIYNQPSYLKLISQLLYIYKYIIFVYKAQPHRYDW